MDATRQILEKHGIKYVNSGRRRWTTECPECGEGYLNVEIKDRGAVWYCQGCQRGGGAQNEQAGSLGPIRAIHDYRDESGHVLFQSVRYEGPPKQFRQRRSETDWSIKGVRIVPYRLPELIEEIALGRTVFVVEGEKDVETLRSHGVVATCNPMGAGKWWAEFNPFFSNADVVICGDNDTPGRKHVALVAQNLYGITSRLRILDLKNHWPEIQESDDITDWFVCHKIEDLWEIVENIPTYTPDGLNKTVISDVNGAYWIKEIPTPEPLQLWDSGFSAWAGKILLAPRTLSVVTGQPGHGKTILWAQIWHNIVKAHDLTALIATFETRPVPHYRRLLRTFESGRLESQMTAPEIEQADDWINHHYRFMIHAKQQPTLEWILELAAEEVSKHKIKILQIDPWNRLEPQRNRSETETEYVLRCLRELSNFANTHNVHVQIIAHPAKMDSSRKGRPPELEDIAGSKAWDTVPDQGFTVYREKLCEGPHQRTEMTLFHRKARFAELGYPCSLQANYDLEIGRFESVIPSAAIIS